MTPAGTERWWPSVAKRLRAILRAAITRLPKALAWTGGAAIVVVLAGAAYVANRLTDDEPVTYADAREHFKYGSTGGERGFGKQFGFGVPYWIWISLPELFPEYLPDRRPGRGYQSFGMLYEPGKDPRYDLPVGMSMRRVQGIDRVYFNCAVCHTGAVRSAPGAPREIVLGMPANTLDAGALLGFLDRSASNWKFRASRVLPKIDDMAARRPPAARAARGAYRPAPLGLVDRMVFDFAGVTLMRDQLLSFTSRLSFVRVDGWGPGRVDTFNPPKALLGFPMERAPAREKVGTADLPAVWNQRWKEKMHLHWDGNNTSVDERNLSAAFGTGATPTTLDRAQVVRVAEYLRNVARPPPFPARHLRADLAASGAEVYREQCWSCHGNPAPPFATPGDGGHVGAVTPVALVGTDRARLDSYTPALAAAQNTLYAGFPRDPAACPDTLRDTDRRAYYERCYPARFSHFRKTNGYANLPLDGLWLRAPYLHNGSVPDLRALLEPAAARPPVFYTGYDAYDYDRVGFVTQGADAARGGWRYDTRLPGNGNAGHEYGTDLPPARKAALLEYLKTF